uniref:N-acetyllactosaminide beta-1,3-N-acetylglucosaminyltransferase n=1 Tax=Strongyloides venezuelensis TaxID=75913 RepID=A0A0K0F1L6_STRVS
MKFLFLFYILLLCFISSISTYENFALYDFNTSTNYTKNFSKPLKSNFAWFHYKNFTVISHIIEGQKPDYLNSLTLVLHISNDRNFNGLEDRLKNWNGPISLGIYMVNDKAMSTETECTICTVKNYLKDRNNVSVHFIFRKTNISDDDMIYLKKSEFCDNFSIDKKQNKCVIVNCKDKLKKLVSYPINTIRNVARKLAHTKFLIVTDSDQMFSSDFIKKVLPVVKKGYSKNKKAVYVIRVFETISENYIDGPKNKKELHRMLEEHKAFVFHHQNIIYLGTPKLIEWFKVKDNNESSIQFENPYDNDAWEPKIIIPDDAPFHDENFPYPFRDNTVMRWSLCIEGYKFLVLNNVFMYHLGVKSLNESNNMREGRRINRSKYVNARKNFTKRYRKKYPKNVDVCMKVPNVEERKKLLSDNIFISKSVKKSKKNV